MAPSLLQASLPRFSAYDLLLGRKSKHFMTSSLSQRALQEIKEVQEDNSGEFIAEALEVRSLHDGALA